MVISSSQRVLTDAWVRATWEEFIAFVSDPTYEKSSVYFDAGEMRIEMPPLGAGTVGKMALSGT